MPSKRRGGGRRRGGHGGDGREGVATPETVMDHHETSVSSPSSSSEREDEVMLTPQPATMPFYPDAEDSVHSQLLNPDICHRSDVIFGDQAVEQLKLRHHKPLKFHERYRSYLRDAGLMGLSQICQHMPQLDKALITALVERWRPETHSFHFASGEMTITLQDVAMLLGLPIDGHPVCSTTDHDYGQMVLDSLGHDPRGPSMPGKSVLRYKWLKKHFYELPDGADDEALEKHVRAYVLSLLCGVLFPDGTGRMSLIYLPLISNLARVGTYSWGSAVLAFLYRSLCSAASSHNIKNIGGPLLLLQLWSWERSHVGRPLVRSPSYTETGNPHDLPPAGFRWVGARTQSENPTRCLKQYRDELNLQRADQIKWEPYVHINASSLPPLCTQAAELWLTQAPLINFPIVEMYLPERVMRQFGLRQCIPPPFRPTLQSLHRISRRGRERENWGDTHREYIREWGSRRQRIFRETEKYDSSSYEEYLRWYSGATRRYLVPAVRNDHEAGPSSAAALAQDSSELQYQPKSPMIRKAVEKLHGMVKKARRSMESATDASTHALVIEFLHGCRDVLHDLGEDRDQECDSAAPVASLPMVLDTQLASPPMFQAEHSNANVGQLTRHEEEDVHSAEHDVLMMEPAVVNNSSDNSARASHVAVPPITSDVQIAAPPMDQVEEHNVDVDKETRDEEKPHPAEHSVLTPEPVAENGNSLNSAGAVHVATPHIVSDAEFAAPCPDEAERSNVDVNEERQHEEDAPHTAEDDAVVLEPAEENNSNSKHVFFPPMHQAEQNVDFDQESAVQHGEDPHSAQHNAVMLEPTDRNDDSARHIHSPSSSSLPPLEAGATDPCPIEQ